MSIFDMNTNPRIGDFGGPATVANSLTPSSRREFRASGMALAQ